MDTGTRDSILDWRPLIVNEAIEWYGTPFHHKGRIKGVGADCGGYIYEVFKRKLGIPHEPFPTEYPEDWALHQTNEIYLEFLRPYVVLTKKLLPGDITVWKYGRNHSHGTIFIGNNRWMHAFGQTGDGSIVKSSEKFFTIGSLGKPRGRMNYTLDEKWL